MCLFAVTRGQVYFGIALVEEGGKEKAVARCRTGDDKDLTIATEISS